MAVVLAAILLIVWEVSSMLTSYNGLLFASISVTKMSMMLNGSTAEARKVLKPRVELL